MCEFKTGDEVLVWDIDSKIIHEKVYLYTMVGGRHVCQNKGYYDNDSVAGRVPWDCIKPAPRYETRVLGPVAMMQRLVDEGYEVNSIGEWRSPDDGLHFNPQMWKYCGKPEPNEWNWHDSWLEKVEVKP